LPGEVRTHALGQLAPLKIVDRFGNWLSIRTLNRRIGNVDGRRVGDFGAGYNAVIARRFVERARATTVVDLALAPDLKEMERVHTIEGRLPAALSEIEGGSLDIALCVSVLEHLTDPAGMLSELKRVLAPGGVLFVNVPSWLGKRFLEFSAFRLNLSPKAEMDDHKTYYDPRDLWPMLVAAGFTPHAITCRRHKFGLNTYAICKVEP
jgi:SAM-dependent methyltransferase